jgi:hypothetical protein
VEDGPTSFRIFLAIIFLTLVWALGATVSEDHFRLGVNFVVLGWICMMPFEGGGAFFAKKNHRGNWRKLEVRSVIVLGLRTILLLQK